MQKEDKKIKIVTTSWDDGHKLDLKLAKILENYNIKGTFYLSKRNEGYKKKSWWKQLSKNQIKALNKDFEIGAHTLTHPKLTELSERGSFREIYGSKVFLEKLINREIKMFSYPKGLYNEKVKNLVKKAGFIGARTVSQIITTPPKDFFEFGTTILVAPLSIRGMCGEIKLAMKNNIKLAPFMLTKDWERIAKRTFDYVNRRGGIYHLWGHSWETEEYDLWKKLEETLRYISGKEDFHYFSNGETLEYLKRKV